jgi:hypothetical protein
MGVVQKILGRAEFKDNKSEYFIIEYNKNNWIHIQNNSIRIEMTLEEFTQFASCVINSANQLIEYKKL